jgi:TctA family transporter
MFEQNLVNSMIKARGNPAAFFERPVAAGLGVLTLLVWLSPLLAAWMRRRSRKP